MNNLTHTTLTAALVSIPSYSPLDEKGASSAKPSWITPDHYLSGVESFRSPLEIRASKVSRQSTKPKAGDYHPRLDFSKVALPYERKIA